MQLQGSTTATAHLSLNARFLLRADTIFAHKDQMLRSSAVDQEHGPLADSQHFPEIAPSFSEYIDPYSHSPFDDDDSKHPDEYVRHAGKEKIVKALLQELGMPDVAHVELQMMGKVFVCGRCNRDQPISWESMVCSTI
jgi:hypothetical protein